MSNHSQPFFLRVNAWSFALIFTRKILSLQFLPVRHIVTKPCILQKCVKERAVKSILCVREISKQDAEDVVDSVFDACFHDTDPFERIPP